MPTTFWIPRPWNEPLSGCVWLGRMLDKARRTIESEREGRGLMNGYLFGGNDYADGKLLKFLNTDDTRLLSLLRGTDDDEDVAATLIRESGRAPDEICAWNEAFQKKNAPFLAMMDADEGQRAPGLGTTLLRLVYNYGLMPPAYLAFRIAQRRRRTKQP